jgi:hypothetical protein
LTGRDSFFSNTVRAAGDGDLETGVTPEVIPLWVRRVDDRVGAARDLTGGIIERFRWRDISGAPILPAARGGQRRPQHRVDRSGVRPVPAARGTGGPARRRRDPDAVRLALS